MIRCEEENRTSANQQASDAEFGPINNRQPSPIKRTKNKSCHHPEGGSQIKGCKEYMRKKEREREREMGVE